MNEQVDESTPVETASRKEKDEPSRTALSLFTQAGAAGDFPVLKAFQEYIEAEQARARKRLIWISGFFVVILVIVVLTFSIIMAAVINRDQQNISQIATRNQELSDKLLNIALQERKNVERVPASNPTVVQPVHDAKATEAALKPLMERIEGLAAKLAETIHTPPPAPVAAPAPVPAPAAVRDEEAAARESAEIRRLQDELKHQKESIRLEREKLKVEQEILRKEKVEQERRRLYPEFYAQKDKENANPKSPKATPEGESAARGTSPLPAAPVATNSVPKSPAAVVPAAVKKAEAKSEDVKSKADEKLQPVSTNRTQEVQTRKVVEPAKPVEPKKPLVAKPIDLKTVKPISYFEDAPEEEAPVKSKDASSVVTNLADTLKKESPSTNRTETLNVGAKGEEPIPFLIELPESK